MHTKFWLWLSFIIFLCNSLANSLFCFVFSFFLFPLTIILLGSLTHWLTQHTANNVTDLTQHTDSSDSDTDTELAELHAMKHSVHALNSPYGNLSPTGHYIGSGGHNLTVQSQMGLVSSTGHNIPPGATPLKLSRWETILFLFVDFFNNKFIITIMVLPPVRFINFFLLFIWGKI